VIIYTYTHHVRLLSPEPAVVTNHSLLGSRESALLCNHQTRHLDFCPARLLTEGLLVRI
jgi:hypothetical protein